jgi:hypothetical protein
MFEQKTARRAFFLSRVKRGPAAGSDYRALMLAERTPLPLSLAPLVVGTAHALVGAIATRTYQPERYTTNIDVLITPTDLRHVRRRLSGSQAEAIQALSFSDSALGLEGENWSVPDLGKINLLWSEHDWVSAAIEGAVCDKQGFAIATLPYLIAMKLDASRSLDQGDISRMLGFADDASLEAVRKVVADMLPSLSADLESYIEIGRLEIGEARFRGA